MPAARQPARLEFLTSSSLAVGRALGFGVTNPERARRTASPRFEPVAGNPARDEPVHDGARPAARERLPIGFPRIGECLDEQLQTGVALKLREHRGQRGLGRRRDTDRVALEPNPAAPKRGGRFCELLSSSKLRAHGSRGVKPRRFMRAGRGRPEDRDIEVLFDAACRQAKPDRLHVHRPSHVPPTDTAIDDGHGCSRSRTRSCRVSASSERATRVCFGKRRSSR